MAIEAETEQERETRHRWRTTFNSVAKLYDASRPGYPDQLIDLVVTTADLGPGDSILEIGCGTGQLTEALASFGLSLIAIDIGPSMIEAARRRLAGSAVRFTASSFEDFTAAESSFDLIISATAFHWIDPDVRFRKSARLLGAGGWLALLATGERYDDPFGSALLDLRIARSEDGGAWLHQSKPSDADLFAASGLFETPVESSHEHRIVLPAEAVIGLENTRATSLSWPPDARAEFTREMRRLLRDQAEVHLTQQTSLIMARKRYAPAGSALPETGPASVTATEAGNAAASWSSSARQ